MLKISAYAKINLHLDVLSKYENGYHEVRTVMQTVSLCDDIELSLTDGAENSVYCDVAGVPNDSRNIACRAADLFFERCGIDKKADIRIEKRIPVAAGLAGGSADAAAVLRGLNALCGHPLNMGELLELGASLGADIPFCIKGGTGYADGTGTALSEFAPMPSCHMVVACGNEGVSTPWAYSMLDSLYRDFAEGAHTPADLSALGSAMQSGNIREIAGKIYNIFEGAIEPHRVEVTKIKLAMKSHGAIGCMMSGSGPSVFGIFESEAAARSVEALLQNMGVAAHYAVPVIPEEI